MVCVSFCVICIVERLVSSVICRFQGLSYLHVPDCIRVFFYFVNSSHYSSYFDFCTKCNILDINLLWNMNFVDHLLFYMKLLNYLFCDMFGSVLECYELTLISWLYTPGNHAWANRHCYSIGCVIKTPIRAYVVVVQLLTFLNLHFIMEWLLQSYFSYKINLNRHIKHENLLSIYENMDYFQIMLFIVTCSVFQKI